MRASTNIALKDRNTLTLEGLKGVDFSSSPHRVAANRAADAVNVIYEDGEIKKRKGWQQSYKFDERINGIFYYYNPSPYHGRTLIHSGKKIYIAGDTNPISTDDMTIKDERSSFFMNNGYCYIVCGDILVYGNFDGTYKLKRLVDMDVYIPTTTINIDAEKGFIDIGEAMVVYEESEDTQVDALENINVFTARRKNTLVGLEYNSQPEKMVSARWKLDAAIKEDSDITVEMYDYTGNKFIVLTNWTYTKSKKKTINGTTIDDVGVYGRYDEFLCDKDGYIYGYVKFGSYSTAILEESICGEIILLKSTWDGSYTPQYNIPAPINGEANITVTFKAAGWEDKRAEITGCTFGTIFGTNGSSNRLFLSGNASCPNRVFYSGYNDFTYFPDVNYINVGSETAKITGFCRLLDNTMAILKEKSFTDPTIYYMTGVQENEYDSSGKLADGRAVFYVEGGGIGEANINPYVTANLAGDALMLSENGVLGITLTQNMTTGARYVKERSYSVNDRLRLYDLSNAAGIVFENRYYLSVGGVCFVADARHKYYREGNDMDQSYNYEWWYWENVPARVWAVIDGKLWFGTADGKLCAFDTDGYEDITYFTTRRGELTVSKAGGASLEYIAFNAADHPDDIAEGNYLTLSGAMMDIFDGKIFFDADSDGYFKTDEDHISRIKPGENLYVSGYPYDEFYNSWLIIDTEITDVDYLNLRFKTKMNMEDIKAYYVDLGYSSYTGIKFTTRCPQCRIINLLDKYFQLEAPWGGVVRFSDESDISAGYVYDYRPISAKWITPYFDMGSSMYGKTLLRLSVTAGEGSDTFLFGYETKRDSSMRPIHGTQSMDFNSFSFNAFSFNNKFASSHTVKTNVRNFNYIRFCFLSEDAVPFSVSKLEALYKINKMNRGVR